MNSKADFEPYLNSTARVKLQSGKVVEMDFIKMMDLPAPDAKIEGVRGEPFCLLFQGPKDPLHHSGMVECQLGDGDPFLLALYPEASIGEKIQYNAIFN